MTTYTTGELCKKHNRIFCTTCKYVLNNKFFLQEVDEEEPEVCSDCGGTGEVAVGERVHPGEPHMAEVGSRPCHCQNKNNDDGNT